MQHSQISPAIAATPPFRLWCATAWSQSGRDIVCDRSDFGVGVSGSEARHNRLTTLGRMVRPVRRACECGRYGCRERPYPFRLEHFVRACRSSTPVLVRFSQSVPVKAQPGCPVSDQPPHRSAPVQLSRLDWHEIPAARSELAPWTVARRCSRHAEIPRARRR